MTLSAVLLPAGRGCSLLTPLRSSFQGHPVHVVVHEGIRHDLGNPGGFIPASVEFGRRHPKYGLVLLAELEVLLEKYRGEMGGGHRSS